MTRERSDMQTERIRNHTQQRRRDIVAMSGIAESDTYAREFILDERLIYGRDIIHEIERDGCVRGSFGSDPS